MKKSILAIAVASLAASSAAVAGDPTVYGNVHLTLDIADNDIPNAKNNIAMHSNTSAIGVKGSEDLGDGMKAIYKVEFGIDLLGKPTTNPDGSSVNGTGGDGSVTGSGALGGRDQFAGLKGGFGTLTLGTMSSNYKQMGGKVDPLYRTPLEGRGFLNTQSKLHGGRGLLNGRTTNQVQYTSPNFGGVKVVLNTTFTGSEDEKLGLGLRWSNKNIMAYVDYIDQIALTPGPGSSANGTDSAFKIGGKFSADAFSVGAQYESAADVVAADYIFLSGTFNMDKNNMIALTYGMRDIDEAAGAPSADTDGLALAYNHKMSKMTNVYVGYGAYSSDVAGSDSSLITLGMRKKF